MRRRFFGGFSAKTDLSDDHHVKNEKERFVSWTVNPFQKPTATVAETDSEEKGDERPQEWLELASDLAWTATFSSLTSNTSVTEPGGVASYAVFFCLAWHLWATQTTYDIRYYTNDWWHRGFFALQLGVYAVLAALSGSFKIPWEIDPELIAVYTGNVTQLTGETMNDNQEYLITKSFDGVNILLFISRVLLLVQYARVLFYRWRTKRSIPWRFWLIPLSLVFSGGVFLGCFFKIKKDHGSKETAITQLILWALALLSQAFAAAFTPHDDEGTLKSDSTMASRLTSLTVIILGEGLNGICGTLRHCMNSLGLSRVMVGQSVVILFILYFIWLLYFDGFKIKKTRNKGLEEGWLYLHLPLHLSLIMLLEGIKNVFIYANVVESFNRLESAFNEVWSEFTVNEQQFFPEHPRMEKLLRVLEISWQEEKQLLETTINKYVTDPDDDGSGVDGKFWRWWGQVIHKVILLYNDNETDPEGEDKFQKFIESNDTALAEDFGSDDRPLLMSFYDVYRKQMEYTGHWIVGVAGGLVLCMAIINWLQRRPRNQFSWGYIWIRSGIGLILIGVGIASSYFVEVERWILWLLPSIVLGYGVAVLLDKLVLWRSVRSIRHVESLHSNLPSLSYNQGRPQRPESSAPGADAQDPKGSPGLLYAAGGGTEKSHGEKSISSSV